MVMGTKLCTFAHSCMFMYHCVIQRFTALPFEFVITCLINLCIWEIVRTAHLHVCIPGVHDINVSSVMAEMDL
jgi:hypothetical protein